jgi:hypothetical protein
MRILTLGAATAVSLALAAAPAPAATPYGWTPATQLSASGEPAWGAEVAYSAAGHAVIAWGRYDGSRYVAEAVTRNADGTLGTVRTVATSDQPLGGPKVDIDDDGDALLAWTRWDGADFRVQARRMPPVGALGGTVSLSDPGQNASAPELAVNQEGEGVIAWTRFDGDDFRVEGVTMATTNVAGPSAVAHVSDDLQEAREVDVAIDGNGVSTFVWARYDTADALILARALRANGSLEASRTLSTLGASAEEPEVVANEAGDLAFAWTRWDGQRDRAQGLVDLASSLPGNDEWVSAAGQAASDARAAIDGTGNATFAWQRWDGGDWRVQSARLPAGGVLAPAETHSASGESATDPVLAVETGGNAAIAWSRWDGAVQRVQVRRITAGGVAGAVNTRSAAGADAESPAVDIRTGGGILLAWQRFDGADDQIDYSVGSATVPDLDTTPTAPAGGVEARP